jgi:hypothetical protein
MKKLIGLAVTMILVLFSSCDEIVTKDLKSSKFELRQLVKQTDTRKSTSGFYFLIAANYGSSEEKVTTINVFAKVEGRFRLIVIPIEDIRINIDNSIKKPNVVIEYREASKLGDEELVNSEYQKKIYLINCPEVYLPERLLPINL